MPKRTSKKRNTANAPTKPEKYQPVRILQVSKNDDLKTLYAKARAAFTAADLERYAQDEEMMPARELIAQLEAYETKARKPTTKRKVR